MPVYRADLEIHGHFSRPDFARLDVAPEDVRIGDAVTALIGDVDGEAVVLFRPAAGEGS